MSTIRNHLLHCIGEESGEISQVIGKAGRFGLFDIHPKTGRTNWGELNLEAHDLIAVVEMLHEHESGHPFEIDRALIDAKKQRVTEYMGYARKVLVLEEAAPSSPSSEVKPS